MNRTVRLQVLAVLAATAMSVPASVRAEPLRSFRGITAPFRSITIKSVGRRLVPWGNRVVKVLVEEGDHVVAGQVLIELERIDEELDVQLHKLLAENVTDLAAARDKERILESQLKGAHRLFDQTKSISREETEKREIEYRVARADRQRLELQHERAQVELAQAESALKKRTLISPIDGTVVRVLLREGESADGDEPVIQIVDTSKVYVWLNVEESVGRTLSRGQSVDLNVQIGTRMLAKKGAIIFVSPVVDEASSLMKVKVEFPNLDGQVHPGVPGWILFPEH